MKRWFGVPRWIVVAGVIGLAAFAAVYGPWAQPSAQVRTIVDGLRGSSVYQEPGAPAVVNAAHARAVIGNRPIVMALLDRTPLPSTSDNPREDLCEQLARQLPTDYVWVYAPDGKGGYDGDHCYGDKFPSPTKAGVSMDDFDIELTIEAETSAQYRATDQDLTPQIEEFVLSFDKLTTDDLGAVPTRGAVPDALATPQIVLACIGMVAGTITLFLLLRIGSVGLDRWSAYASARQSRRRALSAQLNLVADAVIHPSTPRNAADARRQEAVATQYVLLLDKVDHAHHESELAAVEREVAGLVKKVKA